MKEKFQWTKFILDCFLCLCVVIISPFIYSYLIKNDNLQWLLYPTQWIFNINTHTINDIAILIVGFFSLSIVLFLIINFFYKIHKLSLFLSLIFMICYAAFGYYFFNHL